MRTIPTVTLSLLVPALALAQQDAAQLNRQVTTSSAFWFWILAVVVAAVAFILSTIVISRPTWRPRSP